MVKGKTAQCVQCVSVNIEQLEKGSTAILPRNIKYKKNI